MMSLLNRVQSAARGLATLLTLASGVTGLALALITAPPAAMAAPEPSPIPKRWQLEISTSPLMTEVVGGRAFFFMTFRVTNNSAQDLLFAPSFELATDDGDLLRSGRDVPIDVTREIISRLNNALIEDQISIVGTLLRGPENAKQGVVIWPVPQRHLNIVSVYSAGFSGETASVEVPSAAKPGEKERKLLRKSWMMRYRLPGEIKPGTGESFDPVESQWVMR